MGKTGKEVLQYEESESDGNDEVCELRPERPMPVSGFAGLIGSERIVTEIRQWGSQRKALRPETKSVFRQGCNAAAG